MCGSLFRCCLLYILKLLPWEHVSTIRRVCVHACACVRACSCRSSSRKWTALVFHWFHTALLALGRRRHAVVVVVVRKGDGGAHGCSEALRTFRSTAIVNVPDCVLNCIIMTITVTISHGGFNDIFFPMHTVCIFAVPLCGSGFGGNGGKLC